MIIIRVDATIAPGVIDVDIVPYRHIIPGRDRIVYIGRAAEIMIADIPAAAIDRRMLFNRSGLNGSCRCGSRANSRRGSRNGRRVIGRGRRPAAATPSTMIESLRHTLLRTGHDQRQRGREGEQTIFKR